MLLLALGLVASVHSPATSALLPTIVPRADLPRANAIGSTGHELAMIGGPALTGGLLALFAPAVVYGVVACAGLGAAIAYASLPAAPPRDPAPPPAARASS